MTERINYILDTLLTEYTQPAFMHASGISHRMWSMQMGIWVSSQIVKQDKQNKQLTSTNNIHSQMGPQLCRHRIQLS